MNLEAHAFPYPYPYYDEKNGKVKCQVCGKSFLTISPRHLIKHDMKYGDYTTRFPDAPVSSEEFSVRSLYGKNKDMFKNAEEIVDSLKIKDPELETNDEMIIEENPIIEELEILKLKETIVKLDKVQATKKNILTFLSTILPNVKQDIFIEEKSISGHLKYQYISDFADPIRKIAFYFPETFWHNEDVYQDHHRNSKIKEDGWKVVTVKKVNPTLEDIDNALKEVI